MSGVPFLVFVSRFVKNVNKKWRLVWPDLPIRVGRSTDVNMDTDHYDRLLKSVMSDLAALMLVCDLNLMA